MIDYGLEPKLKEIFDYLSSKSKEAYKDIYLLSNETLSKNPFSSSFVRDFVEKKSYKISIYIFFKNFFLFYAKNISAFIIYIFNFLIFNVFYRPSKLPKSNLILLDVFFLVDKIIKNDSFQDSYLGDLKTVLEKEKKDYMYLPIFYSQSNPLNMLKVFRILKRDKISILCEFQLLGIIDFFKLFVFIFVYPISIIKFLSKLGNDEKDKYLKKSIIDGMPDVVLWRYCRYLQGMAVSSLATEKIKVISWHENQTIHRNLLKGLNDSRVDIETIGAQLFLFSPLYMCAFLDEAQKDYRIAPSLILVNGGAYLPNGASDIFRVGPSLRYKKVFTTAVKPRQERKNIVVLLSYFHENNIELLSLLFRIDINAKVIIKAHPATPIELYMTFMKSTYQVANEDIYDLSIDAKVVIACATGAMVEIAALGIPVIAFKGKDSFDYNPLVDFGKGLLWHEVADAQELDKAIDAIDAMEDEDLLKDLSSQYKNLFFCEPTEENIKKAFDL